MKKTLVIFLSLIFLVISTGFTTSEHFCKGVKQETTFFLDSSKDKNCPVCAAKKQYQAEKENCCKHESQLNKIDNSFSNKLQKQSDLKLVGQDLKLISLANTPVLDFNTTELFSGRFSNANLPLRKNALYIYHCVYRI